MIVLEMHGAFDWDADSAGDDGNVGADAVRAGERTGEFDRAGDSTAIGQGGQIETTDNGGDG